MTKENDSYLPTHAELERRHVKAAARRHDPNRAQLDSITISGDRDCFLYTEVPLKLPTTRSAKSCAFIDKIQTVMPRLRTLGTFHIELEAPKSPVKEPTPKSWCDRALDTLIPLFAGKGAVVSEKPHSLINEDCPFNVPVEVTSEDILTAEENEYWAQAVGGIPMIRYPPKSTMNDRPPAFGITWRMRQKEEVELTPEALACRIVKERRYQISELRLFQESLNKRLSAAAVPREKRVYFSSAEEFWEEHERRMRECIYKDLPPPVDDGFFGRHATEESYSEFDPHPEIVEWIRRHEEAEEERNKLDVEGAIRCPPSPELPGCQPPRHWRKGNYSEARRQDFREMMRDHLNRPTDGMKNLPRRENAPAEVYWERRHGVIYYHHPREPIPDVAYRPTRGHAEHDHNHRRHDGGARAIGRDVGEPRAVRGHAAREPLPVVTYRQAITRGHAAREPLPVVTYRQAITRGHAAREPLPVATYRPAITRGHAAREPLPVVSHRPTVTRGRVESSHDTSEDEEESGATWVDIEESGATTGQTEEAHVISEDMEEDHATVGYAEESSAPMGLAEDFAANRSNAAPYPAFSEHAEEFLQTSAGAESPHPAKLEDAPPAWPSPPTENQVVGPSSSIKYVYETYLEGSGYVITSRPKSPSPTNSLMYSEIPEDEEFELPPPLLPLSRKTVVVQNSTSRESLLPHPDSSSPLVSRTFDTLATTPSATPPAASVTKGSEDGESLFSRQFSYLESFRQSIAEPPIGGLTAGLRRTRPRQYALDGTRLESPPNSTKGTISTKDTLGEAVAMGADAEFSSVFDDDSDEDVSPRFTREQKEKWVAK